MKSWPSISPPIYRDWPRGVIPSAESHREGPIAISGRFAHSVHNVPYFKESDFRRITAGVYERLGKELRQTRTNHIGPRMAWFGWKRMGELSHIFGRQYIRAPVRAPRQNGLAERTVRSLKAAQSIAINENRTKPPSVSHIRSYCRESRPSRHYRASPCVCHGRKVRCIHRSMRVHVGARPDES